MAAVIKLNGSGKGVGFIVPRLQRKKKQEQHNLYRNSHIIIEFALTLLYRLLKQSYFQVKRTEILEMLDPFVNTLHNCMRSKHTKMITLAIKVCLLLLNLTIECITFLLNISLPCIKTEIQSICNSVFVLLRRQDSNRSVFSLFSAFF